MRATPLLHEISKRLPVIDKELAVVNAAAQFRKPSSINWTKDTAYPPSLGNRKSTDFAHNPTGQCGVTNYAFGLWLITHRIIVPTDIQYCEGSIFQEGKLLDNKHAWVSVRLRHLPRRHKIIIADLTPGQYLPDDRDAVEVAVNGLSNRRLEYKAKRETSFDQTDYEAMFGDRLYNLLFFMGKAARFHSISTPKSLWLPDRQYSIESPIIYCINDDTAIV